MTITDFTQNLRFTRQVYIFNLTINGKEVEGTYEWEENSWGDGVDIVIENDSNLTEEEYEAVSDYVYDKFGNL